MALQRTVSNHTPESTTRYPDINPRIWATSDGSSIFVKWIPDEMTEADAHRFFETYGQIDRVEIIYKMKDGKKIGRMLFVHFICWNVTFLPDSIAQNHPEPVELEYCVTNRYNSEKIYKLKCCMNIRPIPKVDYTTTQLTDMFENLSKKFADFQMETTSIFELQKSENDRLRLKVVELEKRLLLCERTELDNLSRFEDISQKMECLMMGENE